MNLFSGKYVTLSVLEDEIHLLTMHHDENAFNWDFLKEVLDSLGILRKSTVRALLTTGHGRFFSNGIDIKNMSRQEAQKLLLEFQTILFHFMDLPFPTIALINGHAFGGGFLFSIAHDFRIMNSEKGFICIPAVHLAIKLPQLIIQLLREKIGSINSNELLLLGKRYTAQQAEEMKLVSKICPQKNLITECIQFVKVDMPKDGNAFKEMRKCVYSNVLTHMESKL
jgi:enoyl-CoA hydratase/carnithine racemase